jgi:hypothetical protein
MGFGFGVSTTAALSSFLQKRPQQQDYERAIFQQITFCYVYFSSPQFLSSSAP